MRRQKNRNGKESTLVRQKTLTPVHVCCPRRWFRHNHTQENAGEPLLAVPRFCDGRVRLGELGLRRLRLHHQDVRRRLNSASKA